MAREGEQIKLTGLKAGADLSAKQYHFVKLNASNQVIACNGVTDKPIGVLQNKPSASGQAAEVCVIGETKISSDAALAAGDSIGPSADGQAAAYTAADTTKHICGQVIEASGAAAGLAVAVVQDLEALGIERRTSSGTVEERNIGDSLARHARGAAAALKRMKELQLINKR
jgi:hypothetical protein